MSDKSKEKIYVMGIEFPSNEEMEEFDKELIKKLEESSKDLVEVINSGKAEKVLDDSGIEEVTEIYEKETNDKDEIEEDSFEYNSEGKILASSLKY